MGIRAWVIQRKGIDGVWTSMLGSIRYTAEEIEELFILLYLEDLSYRVLPFIDTEE